MRYCLNRRKHPGFGRIRAVHAQNMEDGCGAGVEQGPGLRSVGNISELETEMTKNPPPSQQ